MEGRGIINVLPRLQAEIVTTSGFDKIVTDPALNDLLVANTHQYQPSKYELQRLSEGIDVIQHSSGCLFSTFLGQGAGSGMLQILRFSVSVG